MNFREVAIKYIVDKKIGNEGKKTLYTMKDNRNTDTLEIILNDGAQKKIVVKSASKKIDKYVQLMKKQELKAFYKDFKENKKLNKEQNDMLKSIAEDLIINSKANDINSFLKEFKKMASKII